MAELSGLAPLIAALRERTAVGGTRCALRTAHGPRRRSRDLAGQLDEQAADPLGVRGRIQRLEAEEARLAAVLADQSYCPSSSPVTSCGCERSRGSIRRVDRRLRHRYQDEAQRGPAAQLATLAARMTADLTAAGVAALDLATDQSEHLVRTILERIGASDIAADLPVQMSAGFDLGLGEPDREGESSRASRRWPPFPYARKAHRGFGRGCLRAHRAGCGRGQRRPGRLRWVVAHLERQRA